MKKYIPEHKVQRMRNLITKKFNDKTKIQIGYGKHDGEHKEGDIWVEGKTTWTIKDGIIQNITKLDSARKSYLMPLICPKCKSKRMKGTLDKMFWRLYGECSKCRLSYETSLKLKREKDENNTEWGDYVSKIKRSNYKTWIKNMYEVAEEFISSTNRRGYITEAGKIEDWSKQDKTSVANTIRENAKNIEKDLDKKFETYEKEMNKE